MKYTKTLLVFFLLFFSGCSKNNVKTEERENDYKVQDCLFTDDFINAASEINLDLDYVKNVNKLGDWIAGTIYEIHYKNSNGKVFCNIDNSVESINFSDTKVYYKNHESLNLSNYLIDQNIAENLKSISIDKVKDELYFPESADFSNYSWGFIHWGDIYGVSSKVKAKNAFGVESEIKFNLHFDISDSSSQLVYFNLDGKVISGELKVYQEDRKENKTENEDKQSDQITLIFGDLGEYGKEVTVDGEKYIYYYLPAGKYKVFSDVNFCKVYLDKNNTSDNVITLTFNNGSDYQELTIEENEHIEITLSAKVRFEKVD